EGDARHRYTGCRHCDGDPDKCHRRERVVTALVARRVLSGFRAGRLLVKARGSRPAPRPPSTTRGARTMAKEFEVRFDGLLPAEPDRAWAAITNSQNAGWLWESEYETRLSGAER